MGTNSDVQVREGFIVDEDEDEEEGEDDEDHERRKKKKRRRERDEEEQLDEEDLDLIGENLPSWERNKAETQVCRPCSFRPRIALLTEDLDEV
jgi:transcription elongation factor SPT6